MATKKTPDRYQEIRDALAMGPTPGLITAAPEITEDIARAVLEAASAELQRVRETGTDAELTAANRRFSETLDRLRRQVTKQNKRQGYVSVDPETLRDVASWVIRNKETGDVVMETFDRAKVEALNTEKYEAVPVKQHLQELNEKLRAASA